MQNKDNDKHKLKLASPPYNVSYPVQGSPCKHCNSSEIRLENIGGELIKVYCANCNTEIGVIE